MTHPDYDRCTGRDGCGRPRFQHEVDPTGSFNNHTFHREHRDYLIGESEAFEAAVDRLLQQVQVLV